MIVYLDTSAFVKLVLDEPGDAAAREWFSQARWAVSSVITYPESCSAVGRRSRYGDVDEGELRRWTAELDERWRRVVAVPVGAQQAGLLALEHRLRGMDAVQLAAAVTFRTRVTATVPDEQVVFAAFDRRLREAAEREGFATLGGPPG